MNMFYSKLACGRSVMSHNVLIKIAKSFYELQEEESNIRSKALHLIGLEPTLWKSNSLTITELVHELSANGFEVEMTTNGSTLKELSHRLKISGLKKCRVSFYNYYKDVFFYITGKDMMEKVKEGIESALKKGLPVKINRLILRDNISDIPDFLDFISRKHLTVKFLSLHPFSLHWNQYYLPVKDIIERFVLSGTKDIISSRDERTLQRVVYYHLKKGGIVEVRKGIGDFLQTFPFCYSCKNYYICKETDSLIPPAVTLTVDNKLVFCPIKKTPCIDFNNLILENASVEELKDYMKVRVKEEIFEGQFPEIFLPIRAVINNYCNFQCSWCHENGMRIHDSQSDTLNGDKEALYETSTPL